MKNLSSIILIFISISCSAQIKKETLKIGTEKYKVTIIKRDANYQSRTYYNINNKYKDSIPGYAKDPMEPYLDQKSVQINKNEVLRIVKEFIKGKLPNDKRQSLLITFKINPKNGTILELDFYNSYITDEFPDNLYPKLEEALKKQIVAEIKTDRYQKYPFVERFVIFGYDDFALEK